MTKEDITNASVAYITYKRLLSACSKFQTARVGWARKNSEAFLFPCADNYLDFVFLWSDLL